VSRGGTAGTGADEEDGGGLALGGGDGVEDHGSREASDAEEEEPPPGAGGRRGRPHLEEAKDVPPLRPPVRRGHLLVAYLLLQPSKRPRDAGSPIREPVKASNGRQAAAAPRAVVALDEAALLDADDDLPLAPLPRLKRSDHAAPLSSILLPLL
jgi:hypothetical protein